MGCSFGAAPEHWQKAPERWQKGKFAVSPEETGSEVTPPPRVALGEWTRRSPTFTAIKWKSR